MSNRYIIERDPHNTGTVLREDEVINLQRDLACWAICDTQGARSRKVLVRGVLREDAELICAALNK